MKEKNMTIHHTYRQFHRAERMLLAGALVIAASLTDASATGIQSLKDIFHRKPAPAKGTPVIRTDVPEQAFFKDLFIDSGLEIVEHDNMPAADFLGLSQEIMRLGDDTPETDSIQRAIICGNEDDTNGRLLYPDGSPRFSCIYVYGGLSNAHGITLGERGRERFRTFFENGGSYTGSCAGAFICCRAFDLKNYRPGYIGLWPGTCDECAVQDIFPTYIIPKDSPLLKYCDFGGDFKVDSVEHCNGPFFSLWKSVPGTEQLAVNHLPGYKLDGYTSIIARKNSPFTGRLVPCGGHPELAEGGERRDLMAAILGYAIDGRGCARVKTILDNGKTWEMTAATEDNIPEHTKIGDRQCHHFVFAMPARARNVRIRLNVLSDHNLSLRLAEGTFAFDKDAQYKVENGEKVKELNFVSLPEGTYYIGVQCEDSVTVEPGRCDRYDSTDLLNGVPYTITVSWNEARRGDAVLLRGADINERLKALASGRVCARATDRDSIIKKIIFKTSTSRKGCIRLDADGSEEPVYASIDKNGVVTITTPAAKFTTCGILSNLFNGLDALKSVENYNAIELSGCMALPELPECLR